jgi:hypothetical protein
MSKAVPKTTNLPPDVLRSIEDYAARRTLTLSAAIRGLAEIGLAVEAQAERHALAQSEKFAELSDLFSDRLGSAEQRIAQTIDGAYSTEFQEANAKIGLILDRMDRLRDFLREALIPR